MHLQGLLTGGGATRRVLCVISAVVLGGCATFKEYAQPSAQAPRAHVKFMFNEGLTVGKFMASPSPTRCGFSHDGMEVLSLIANGNPLIPNVNPDGLYVAAGNPLRIKALTMPIVPSTACERTFVFTPSASAEYEIRFADRCSLSVHQKTAGHLFPVPVQFEKCL